MPTQNRGHSGLEDEEFAEANRAEIATNYGDEAMKWLGVAVDQGFLDVASLVRRRRHYLMQVDVAQACEYAFSYFKIDSSANRLPGVVVWFMPGKTGRAPYFRRIPR
jgi:hypothetical protein